MKTKLYLTVLLLLQAFIGFSQPGDIDNTFNSSGIGGWGQTAVPPVTTDAVQQKADACVYNSRVYTNEDANKDKMIIVGRFISFNGDGRRYIARINADGTTDLSFSGPVFPLGQYIYNTEIMPDGKILIMGGFSLSSGGVTYRNVMRLLPNGLPDNTFGTGATRGANNPVHSIALQTDGKIILGGDFSSYNAVSCKNVIRIDANGAIDTFFNTAPGDFTGTRTDVRALAMQGDKIIVGGYFSGYTGYVRNKILRLNSDGSFDTTFNNYAGVTGDATTGATGGGGDGAVYDLFVLPAGPGVMSNRIYAAGKFDNYNGSGKVSIVRLTANGLFDTTFNSAAGHNGLTIGDNNSGAGYGYCVFSIKEQPDGNLLLGGNFVKYNGVTIPKAIVRIKPSGEMDTNFITGTGFVGGTDVYQGKSVIRDILMQSDQKIVVGGDFESYNTTSRRMLARIRTRVCTKAGIYSLGTWTGDGIPVDNTYYMAITKGTFTIPTGTNMVACELEVKAGATLIIQPGASLTVNGIVMNNGSFTVENTGSLVQVAEDTKNADLGAGIFTMKRNVSNLKGFDFVYWSSPVEDQTLHDLSPNTRPDKYYKFNTSINNWQIINGGYETMEEGKGYIARAPAEYLTTNSYTYPAAFIGRPHNGKIQVPIIKAGTSNMNLVGNPYPSAIDASLFLNDVDNKLVVGGTIYLWTHQTGIATVNSGTTYSYASSDYAAYNKVGGTMTNPTGTLFQGKVAAGQGFFLEALSTTNAFFKNTMRVKNNNAQFYKSDATTATQGTSSRLWLNFANDQGAFKQTLIGFTDDSSNGLDRNDGNVMNGNSFVNFYSIVEDKNLVIQGRALPFDNNQVIPLGYSTTIAGNFTISLYQFDGLFSEQNVYLIDKLKNTTQEIKSSGYSFSTTAGTFNNRFEIRFTNGLLNTYSIAKTNESAIIMADNNTVSIQAFDDTIDSITMFDLTGKLLYTKKGIAAATFTTDQINVHQQMVMVQIKMTNGNTLTKKVLLN